MTDFHNLVVHHYAEINLNKVYDYVEKAPIISRQFAEYFTAFLEKSEKA